MSGPGRVSHQIFGPARTIFEYMFFSNFFSESDFFFDKLMTNVNSLVHKKKTNFHVIDQQSLNKFIKVFPGTYISKTNNLRLIPRSWATDCDFSYIYRLRMMKFFLQYTDKHIEIERSDEFCFIFWIHTSTHIYSISFKRVDLMWIQNLSHLSISMCSTVCWNLTNVFFM